MLHPHHNIARIALLTSPTLQERPTLLEFLPELRVSTERKHLFNTPGFNPNDHESTLNLLKHYTELRECLSDSVEVLLVLAAEGMESVPGEAEDCVYWKTSRLVPAMSWSIVRSFLDE